MGCDIHGCLEYNYNKRWTHKEKEKTPIWEHLMNTGMFMDRNYKLFGDLFGVRKYDEAPIIIGLRGIPKDWLVGPDDSKSLEHAGYRDYVEGGADWHSPSWAFWSELKGYFSTANPAYTTLGNDWIMLADMMRLFAKRYGENDIRLVVWFDN